MAVRKQIGLQWQKTSSTVTQVNHRKPIFNGDVQRTDNFLDRQRVPGSAFDAGIIRMDDDLPPVNDADARNLAGALDFAVVGLVGHQCADFQKRRARVEQQIQALANRQLFLAVKAFDITIRTLESSLVHLRLQCLDLVGHGSVVFFVAC